MDGEIAEDVYVYVCVVVEEERFRWLVGTAWSARTEFAAGFYQASVGSLGWRVNLSVK